MLTNLSLSSIVILLLSAAIAQEVERSIGSAEVTGPTPVSSFLTTPLFKPISDKCICKEKHLFQGVF